MNTNSLTITLDAKRDEDRKAWLEANDIHVDELVNQLQWNTARDKESADSVHPCDTWHPANCMCNGGCSCHFMDER